MSKKLLLADDSITIQKVIGITFANEDYELTVVDNGDAALEKARSESPDLILADVFMPGKNGYELCAAVRQEPALRGIPVLLLTGTFEPFDENKARAAGADSWIAKPFESQALIDRVEELLARPPQPSPVVAAPPTPAAVSAAVQAFSTAPVPDADIWGDLAETVSAEAGPTAETPPDELPAAAPVIPSADEEQELEADIWGAVTFDEEDLLAAEPSGEAAEDIWQAMDEAAPLDEAPPAVFAEESFFFDEEPLAAEPPPAAPAESPAVDEFIFEEEEATFAPLAAGELSELDEDIFALEELDILEEEELEAGGATPVEETTVFAEEKATFLAETPASRREFGNVPVFEPVASAEEQPISFEEEFTLTEEGPEWGLAEESGVGIEPSALADEAFLISPAEAAMEPEPAAAPPAVAVVAERVRALTDDELAQIVERVAGSVLERLAGAVLERIAWEVVPDLAENLVREEIRRIREEAGARL
jgi:CheY-like chemotaxis protein